MADQQFYLISLPYDDNTDQHPANQFHNIQRQLGTAGSALRHFIIPQLKVGTLDSLMEASDELAKLDPQMESACLKLVNLLEEASGKTRAQVTQLRVNQQSQELSCEGYLKVFSWSSAQFDHKESIRSILEKLTAVTTGAEERVRMMMVEYNQTRTTIAAVSRKNQGSYAVKPIDDAVRKWCAQQKLAAPVESEFLTTIFVAVPNAAQKDWLANYATFHNFVCPQSSSVVASDEEVTLNSVVLFKKAADDFKQTCRRSKYIVREYAPSTEMTNDELFRLQAKASQEQAALVSLLTQQFTLCYTAWIHAKAVRVFVESLLKYGLPPKFVAVLLAVDSKRESEIRSKLKSLYTDASRKYDDDVHQDPGALQQEYPYVSLKVANVMQTSK